jgi:hypothetical protein
MQSNIDCVAMKRRIQAEIFEQIKDLSDEQRVEWMRRKAEQGRLGEWWKGVKALSSSIEAERRRKLDRE